jgi:peptide/nickel transport system permease protein
MVWFIAHRLLLMVPTVFAISILSFMIVQLPPGDFVTTVVAALEESGEPLAKQEEAILRERYGLDRPAHVQYLKWLGRLIRGDLGRSLQWSQPVKMVLAQRIPWSVTISLMALILVYLIGIPIGTISATRQYSTADYFFTVVGFIGLAIPDFLFALILLWLYFLVTGNVALGLFSQQYLMAPWSLGKVLDLLNHLWMPALVVATAGTAGLIRIMRANLLEELQKPYVMVARAKGLPERRMLYKYPLRIALNPVVSTVGWTLPRLVSGELLVSMVLGLPTIAPVFINALQEEDVFLAGSIVLILSVLTVLGTLISDILLGWVDPRIRLGAAS